MPRYFHTHLTGPDMSARVWFPSTRLRGMSGPIVVGRSFDFNLSPIVGKWSGRLTPQAVFVRPGECADVLIWLGLPDAKRQLLHIGFQFDILPLHVVDAPNDVRVVGYGAVTKVLEPITYFYTADAEVSVTIQTWHALLLLGQLFDFEFPRLEKRWKGHLDNREVRASGGRSLGTGMNGYLCLHDLTLSQGNSSPGGQPFVQGDVFNIWTADALVGSGVVSQLPGGDPELRVCEPVLNI
jgi:hypothetical protein